MCAPRLEVGLDIREEMRERLPHWTQGFLTYVTGKAHRGQIQRYRRGPADHLALAIVLMLVGVVGSYIALSGGMQYWLLIPIAWIFTVGGARRLQINIVHACVHFQFFKSRNANVVLGEFASAFICTQDFWAYRGDHVLQHHGKAIATPDDPDMKVLGALGIRPGIPKRQMWQRLLWALISPTFHFALTMARLRANFWDCPWYRITLSALVAAGTVGFMVYGSWIAVLICWIIPVFPMLHVSALLQFSCEHKWGRRPQPCESAREHYVSVSFGRFVGVQPPAANLAGMASAIHWTAWGFKMMLSLLVRIGVFMSTVPAHDYHHLHAMDKNWANLIYDRQRAIDRDGIHLVDSWGLLASIDMVFEELSQATSQSTETAEGAQYLSEVINS